MQANNPTDRKLLDEWNKIYILAQLVQTGRAKIEEKGGVRYITIKKDSH